MILLGRVGEKLKCLFMCCGRKPWRKTTGKTCMSIYEKNPIEKATEKTQMSINVPCHGLSDQLENLAEVETKLLETFSLFFFPSSYNWHFPTQRQLTRIFRTDQKNLCTF